MPNLKRTEHSIESLKARKRRLVGVVTYLATLQTSNGGKQSCKHRRRACALVEQEKFYLCSMSHDIKYCCSKTDLREFSFSHHKSFMDESTEDECHDVGTKSARTTRQ
jgi:hypothetical protein